MDEIGGRHALLPFELHFEQFEPARPQPNKQMTASSMISAAAAVRSTACAAQVQVLAAKRGVRTRATAGNRAEAIQDFPRRELKIDSAVSVFLRMGASGMAGRGPAAAGGPCQSCLQPAEGFNQQGRRASQPFAAPAFPPPCSRAQLQFPFCSRMSPSIESGIDPHRRYASHRFAVRDSPLNRAPRPDTLAATTHAG